MLTESMTVLDPQSDTGWKKMREKHGRSGVLKQKVQSKGVGLRALVKIFKSI